MNPVLCELVRQDAEQDRPGLVQFDPVPVAGDVLVLDKPERSLGGKFVVVERELRPWGASRPVLLLEARDSFVEPGIGHVLAEASS